MIEIRKVTEENQSDIRLKNDPFPLYGRLVLSYTGEQWGHTVEKWQHATHMCFPDENYDYMAMRKEYAFFGAYDSDQCVGLVILKHDWTKYLYVEDLKVSQAYRGQGIGRQLIHAAMNFACEHGYRGLQLVAQDNNLAACLFYLRTGFRIGGLNTEVYNGTSQEGKRDILFFLDG